MTPSPPETDDKLLIRIRSGDEEAFAALYRQRQAAIYRFALHMSGSMPAAEDVVQEVFLVLLREDCGFDPERGTLSGYLFGIARKLVLRHVERGRSDVALESELDEAALPELAVNDDPLAELTEREGIAALRRAVQALPRRYREVVILCDLEEVIMPTRRSRWAVRSARCVPGCIARAGCCWINSIRSGIPGRP